MSLWKRRFLLETILFRFHVKHICFLRNWNQTVKERPFSKFELQAWSGLSHCFNSRHDFCSLWHWGTSAPKLLWSLLDGLVWRSRQATNGKRRVNFYVPCPKVWTFGMQVHRASEIGRQREMLLAWCLRMFLDFMFALICSKQLILLVDISNWGFSLVPASLFLSDHFATLACAHSKGNAC